MLVLERAPEDEAGGNSRFTAGLFRIAYKGADDLKTLIPDLSDDEIANTDFGTYTEEQFLDDMARVTEYRCDPDLTEILVKQSLPTCSGCVNKGVRFTADLGPAGLQDRRQVQVLGRADGRGGRRRPGSGRLADAAREEGRHRDLVRRARMSLVADDSGVHGVRRASTGQDAGRLMRMLSCSPQAASRRTPNGELVTSARDGNSRRCAARVSTQATGSAWRSMWAPRPTATGRAATRSPGIATRPRRATSRWATASRSTRIPWGVYINAEGKRFVDEGADFRNYTYAKYGRVILGAAGAVRLAGLRRKVKQQLRDEYRIRQVTKVTGNTLEELVREDGRYRPARLRSRMKKYNAAVRTDIPFNPNVKDGRCTKGSTMNKSNWANTLDTPPFEAYAVTCGITFTFGGLRSTPTRR